MKKISKSTQLKLGTSVTFLFVVVISLLANLFRFNGTTTGEVSKIYESMFVPAPYTFLIWILIYTFLLFYVIFILFLKSSTLEDEEKEEFYTHLTVVFGVSSVVNIAWVLSWQYDLMILSMICTCVLFAILTLLVLSFRKMELSKKEIYFIQIPFSMYYGWVIFSIFANATVITNKFSLASTGKPEEYWTILLIGALTAFTIIFKIIGRNPIYGIPILWGMIGMIYRHVSMTGYAFQYVDIVIELIICSGLWYIMTAYYMFSGKAFTRKRKSLSDTLNSVVEEATEETIINHSFKEYETIEEMLKQKEMEAKQREADEKSKKKK